MQTPIKFIYFDLGNILVQVDQVKASEQFKIWLKHFNHVNVKLGTLYDIIYDSVSQNKWESGFTNQDQHVESILNKLQFFDQMQDDQYEKYKTKIINQAIGVLCYNSFAPMILESQILHAIQGIKYYFPQVKLGILSNTCDAHWSYISDHFPIVSQVKWDHIILSYEHGCMKPNEQIYQIAQDKTNCDKDQVLFIDDRDDNVEAANQFGWNAHVAMGGLDICNYLSTYGLIT